MKKRYEKPVIEIERYTLRSCIANGCVTKVDLFPSNPSETTLSGNCYVDYETLSLEPDVSTAADATDNPFASADSCTCYYGSGNGKLFNS